MWHVPGASPSAGTFEGRDALWERHLEPLWPSPARIGKGQILDHGEQSWDSVEVFRLAGGRVVERREFTARQAELDQLLSRGCAAAR